MHYHNHTDETLVMLTLAGDQSAYEALVTRYQKTVIASAMSVTNNYFMAEDAAQDAFVTAWMKLNTLQEADKFAAWVCRIAKNCALNMINRYRSFLPLDAVENVNLYADNTQNPADLCALSEEKNEISLSVAKLPNKVRQIINMHYFEGLSIAEIADRMRISEGTVKWQLHDGRKRIRKELCAMNEKYSDTLVQRVMKKVEELKLWQLKNDKSGFEKVYKDVLREVEELPESRDKNHALADVLMRGWWWLPGKKNDALFARIAAAALEGKNEEVMTFIVTREDSKLSGDARIEFMRDKQIPRLEKAGFVKALGHEWFWLGYNLFREGKAEEGSAAFGRAEKTLTKGNAIHALIPLARNMHRQLLTTYKNISPRSYSIAANADEFRYIDGRLSYWSRQYISKGHIRSIDEYTDDIFINSSKCDGCFFADIEVGESVVGTDGTILTYASSSETVTTPAGEFDGCQKWVTTVFSSFGRSVFTSFYKNGVGIVKHEHTSDSITDVRLLSAYNIKSGSGLLPIGEGNTWEYSAEYDLDVISLSLKFAVAYADEKKVIVTSFADIHRHKYETQSWVDTIQEIRNEYFHEENGSEYICDVYPAIERAEALAKTDMEKAHTKAAASVARRILATDPKFNPGYTATGHWNFFMKSAVHHKKGTISIDHNYRWSFEWKHAGDTYEIYPVLYNDIYGILQDATNCIWSDEWRVGASPIVEYTKWTRDVRTEITCMDGGTVVTKAGTFDNCLKLCMEIGGMTGGWRYRGGRKVYYFADGIGIVRTENEYCDGARTAVYELTSYTLTGKGYMPVEDGMVRKYDAIGLTDGYVGAAEYTYVADEYGDVYIFADRTGIRNLPPAITQYSSIVGEVTEDNLANSGKWQEAHFMHSANNVNLMLHYLARSVRNMMNAERSIAIHSFNKKLMLLFGGGSLPDGWVGLYAWSSLIEAAALFGHGDTEQGYSALEEAAACFKKWNSFKDGDELPLGDGFVFGGIKYKKGKNYFVYPDGRYEPAEYQCSIDPDADSMYICLTQPYDGWEWFNAVRNEDRFKEYIERAKKMADKA